MTHTNFLIISSDEHNKRFLGCYGHEIVQTPNLDRLAAMGTRFANAYTPSPICMPARAGLATGRYIYQIGNWDNGTPYTGQEADSWGHRLRSQGVSATTFGKLHFHPKGDSGYEEHLPLHAKLAEEGYTAALFSWLGEKMPVVNGLRKEVLAADIGEFGYTRYDRSIAQAAAQWLQHDAPTERKWCSFVSFTYPHYPFMAPAEYVNRYDPDSLPLPINWREQDWSDHPVLRWRQQRQSLDQPFSEEEIRKATAIYYGMVSFLDDQIGIVLDALANSDHAANTRILYISDHGESLGEHGFWFKGTMHESSAGIPMILAGADVPANHVCHTPVSLVDVYPTAVEAVGAQFTEQDADLLGQNLIQIANQPDQERTVFSEYHAVATPTSIFMMRDARWKYIEYPGYPAQLFDMLNDPDEQTDLATNPAYTDILATCAANMRDYFSPEQVDTDVRTFHDAQIERLGGVKAVLNNIPKSRPYTPPPTAFAEG